MTLETVAWPSSYGEGAKSRMGFFTDTSVCIGCKACEVACKEWNGLPADDVGFTGQSYDNTGALGAATWRHVAFIEQDANGAMRSVTMTRPSIALRMVTTVIQPPCSRPRSRASAGEISQNISGCSSAR